jgi:hypothetical protein
MKKIVRYALKQLRETCLEKKDWAIGEGTVLKHFYRHRHSKD